MLRLQFYSLITDCRFRGLIYKTVSVEVPWAIPLLMNMCCVICVIIFPVDNEVIVTGVYHMIYD